MIKKVLFLTPLEKLNIRGGISSWTSKINKYGLPDNFKHKIIDTSIHDKRGIFYNKLQLIPELTRNGNILFKLILELIKYNPSIVHLNCSISPFGLFRDFIAVFLIKLFSISLVIHYRGNLPQPWSQNFYFAKHCLNILIKKADMNLAMNSNSLTFLNSIKKNNLNNEILESFIDDSIFSLNNNYINDSNSLRIIFVGAFAKSKGGVELINLAKVLQKHKFIFIGKTSHEMERFIIDLPKNVSYLGQINRDEIYKELQKSDVFLFPSHTEGFPNAVLEAMALGLPIIGTNVGSIPSMIEQGIGGYVVNIREIKKMKEHIEYLSFNPKLRRSMGIFNKNKSKKKYSYSVVTNKLINIYKNILNFKTNGK